MEPISFIASAYQLDETDTVSIDFKLERAFKLNKPQNFSFLQNNSTDNKKTNSGVYALCRFFIINIFLSVEIFF